MQIDSIVARQVQKTTGQTVEWEHKEPGGATVKYTNLAQTTATGREEDPNGVAVRARPSDPQYQPDFIAGFNYDVISDFEALYGGGCTLNGEAASDTFCNAMLASEAAARCPENDCGPRVFTANGKQVFSKPFIAEGGTGGRRGYRVPLLYSMVVDGEKIDESIEGWLFKEVSSPLLPDPPRPFDIPKIIEGVKKVMDTDGCRSIIEKLLNAVASKKNPLLEKGDINKLLDLLIKQGGFTRQTPKGSAGYGSPIGSFEDKTQRCFQAILIQTERRNLN